MICINQRSLIWIKAKLEDGGKMRAMNVGDIMTRKPSVVSPEDAVERAASLMARVNAGILPVLSGTRMVGVVTDRDIVVRAVATGKPAATCRVDDVMTEDVHYCLADDAAVDVARRMGEVGVRRMPVLDRNNALVGVVSLDDIAAHVQWEHAVADALRKLARFSRGAATGMTPCGRSHADRQDRVRQHHHRWKDL